MTRTTPDVVDGVERLPIAEAWRLLRRSDRGRLAVAGRDGLPELVPVTYVVRGTHLYLRPSTGATISGMASRAEVTFEVDGTDGVFRWSVVTHAAAGALRVSGEVPVVAHFVPSTISGRRFRDTRLSGRRGSS